MGKILCCVNDVVDAENIGLPADLLRQRGHNVLVVCIKGCPAMNKLAGIVPEWSVLPVRHLRQRRRLDE